MVTGRRRRWQSPLPGSSLLMRPNTKAIWATTATPSTIGTGGPRSSCGRWNRRSSCVVRAEAGSGWALRTLADRPTQGQIAEAAADTRSLEPFWSGAGPESLDMALEAALGVEDGTAATVVLTPYGIAGLGAEQAEALGALTERYGTSWLRDLLGSWASSGPHFTSPGVRALIEWVNTSMASTIAALRTGESASGATVAEVLTSHTVAFIPQQVA